jgi:hypothetical protein|tara:strand:+ start:185 stop:406 length:222 start_codon:yes stop_codon:yes gene_type:complete
MATKIVTKNSSTASAIPLVSDLVQGELAVNVTDARLFTENNSAAIVELGAKWGGYTVSTAATGTDATTIYFRT